MSIIDCMLFCCYFNILLREYDEKNYLASPGIFRPLINFASKLEIDVFRIHDYVGNFKSAILEIRNFKC